MTSWLTPYQLSFTPYKFGAYHDAAQNSGNAAFAIIAFNTEEFDTGGVFASNTFTAPVAGFYFFVARTDTTTALPTRLIVSLFKNGAEFKRGVDLSGTLGAGAGVMASSLVSLAANDTMAAYSFGSTTLSLEAGQANTYFQGYLVSLL